MWFYGDLVLCCLLSSLCDVVVGYMFIITQFGWWEIDLQFVYDFVLVV